MKYKELITKSEQEQQSEQVELNVAQAQNTLEQGILSVKSEMLKQEAKVKQSENREKESERVLEASKSANPFSVQNILDARTNLEQAKLNTEAEKEAYTKIKEAHDYLETLKNELF